MVRYLLVTLSFAILFKVTDELFRSVFQKDGGIGQKDGFFRRFVETGMDTRWRLGIRYDV